MIKIAYCTTCKGRVSHLSQTLPKNLIQNPDATFVVLDYDDRDGLEDYLRQFTDYIERGQLVVYTYRNGGAPFHVAHAKNLAARCALREGAQVLVTLDADNATGPGFTDFIRSHLTNATLRQRRFLCPDFDAIHLMEYGPQRPQRGFAGRMALGAQMFLKAGFYDEQYETWRGEDIDLIARLRRFGFEAIYFPNHHLEAIPHNAAVRFKEYPHARAFENRGEYHRIKGQQHTLVNFGRMGCGTVTRNFDSEPITFRPLPTRVFGIGLHRTGTTSLDKAFQLFGYDSLHWGSGEAPKIWDEVHRQRRSPTLERFYAASDLPIPLLYRELDQAYPGSKFILTLRDREDWVDSVARLWDPKTNPSRYLWDQFPFSHFIHSQLYGTSRFDRATMLDRYDRHNREVRRYFEGRPNDLLVLDIDRADWGALTTFLDEARPDEPFPHENCYQGEC